jgi:hypothetical protein
LIVADVDNPSPFADWHACQCRNVASIEFALRAGARHQRSRHAAQLILLSQKEY